MRALIVSLIIIAVIVVFAFSALAQGNSPTDPFLAYADFLTIDQTPDDLENRNFSCKYVLSDANQICSLELEDRYFSEIRVAFAKGVSKSVSFQVIEDTLRVGDLVTFWGKPYTLSSYYMLWQEQNGVTTSALVSSADRLNYLAPVWVASFTFE